MGPKELSKINVIIIQVWDRKTYQGIIIELYCKVKFNPIPYYGTIIDLELYYATEDRSCIIIIIIIMHIVQSSFCQLK